MDLLRWALRRGSETRGDFGWPSGTIPPPGQSELVGADISGTGMPDSAALQLIDAYACVSLITDSVSMLPVNEFIRGDVSRTPVPEEKQSAIIRRPDPDLEPWEWRAQMVCSMALRGNAYSYHYEWDDLRQLPIATRALHPDDVTPQRSELGHREYKIRSTGEVIPAYRMMHIPLVLQPGALKGLSPIDCARRGIRMAINTERFGDRWFTDGAAPSSVLETEEEMDDTEAAHQQARWIVANGGGRRLPAVLSGGLKWKPVTITPNESQFLESRKLNTSQIARIWRVPPHMIGDVEKSTSWGSGLEEQGIGFTVYTAGSYLFRLEAAFDRCTARDRRSKINVNALLRGNSKDRFLSYAIARQWGWLSVNDIRALEDLPPVAGGDIYLQPLNMIDASEALDVLLKNTSSNNPGGAAA